MVVLTNRVLELALEWSRLDPNETTAKYLEELLDRARRDNDEATKSQIIALFPEDNSRIGFGTAGLRAAMDIGPLRMNDMVIVQTAQGIATYCKEQNAGVSSLRVIVGYDHRSNPKFSLSSLSFAILTVLVFQQAGIECILLDDFVATPLVPFCTTRLGAVVGIMVTASHNPKEDAGYKVYWKDGCQIRPPVDKDIAKAISEQLTPWTDYRKLLSDRRNMYAHSPTFGLSNPELTTSLKNQYFEAIRGSGLVSQSTRQSSSLVTPPAFCYTAMHGVGHSFATQVFSVFGLAPFLSVPEQEAPDPMFPTVSFPNPEEKGALDLAKAFAEKHACDVVLANDPDADRLAVAERNRQTGEWYVFTGDEIGALLGSWLWEIMGKNSSKVSFLLSLKTKCCESHLRRDQTLSHPISSMTLPACCNVCISRLIATSFRNGSLRRFSL
jgi:phosphoglucomutase